MLLVKSKESKSSNNINGFSFPTLMGLLSLLTLAPYSLAQSGDSSKGPDATSIVSVALSLLLIIGLLFFLGYLMRRFSFFNQAAGGNIKTVASIMVGTRERIAVIQVGDEQHLIGVTAQNINHLAKLDKPLQAQESGVSFDKGTQTLKNTFANLLQQQKHIQGKDK